MNSDFHYLDGLKLRILCSVILFCGILSANYLLTDETEKNALVQAAAYTGRSDFITETFGFDENGTFLVQIKKYTNDIIEKIIN
ncbi:MAG: hypothetical protein Q4E73_08620 [Lachnospiraceae bacterium]|nr:hypothetical protein [Lachnospiraceae bacterium]